MAVQNTMMSCAFALLACPALAQTVSLDLNATHPRDGACQFVFVGQNETDADVEQLVLEAVLFNTEGRVAAMTLLDMQDLPAGRMRVRSFEIGGVDCGGVSRLLINGISTCSPVEAPACTQNLTASSSLEIEVLQ